MDVDFAQVLFEDELHDREEIKAQKYRIHWRAVRTGATGNGTYHFTNQDYAQGITDSLNQQNKGITYHWVEEVEND